MNFLQESVLRRYFAFLLLFLALLTGFGILYGTNCIQAEKNLLLAHDRAFVSSLLEEDIPPETILRALKQAKETERGAPLCCGRAAGRNGPPPFFCPKSGRRLPYPWGPLWEGFFCWLCF